MLKVLFRRVILVVCALACCGCKPTPPRPSTAGLPVPASDNATAYRFDEVAAQAGIHYQWSIPGKRPLNILQTIGNGCAFLDYDNDGNLDILLIGPKLALYKGDGHGHFTDVTHATGLDKLHGNFLGCAVGDYDNDGYEDIYLSAYRGGVLLHNESNLTEGNLTEDHLTAGQSLANRTAASQATAPRKQTRVFRDVTQEAGIAAQPWGTSASFVDIDNDGRLDLLIGNYVVFGPHTNPQLCAFSGIMAACGPRYYKPEFAVLYHNQGNGRFRDVTRATGIVTGSGKTLGIACADYDGSGRQGVVFANDEMPGDLLENKNGHLQNIGPRAGVALDNDGHVHGGMGIDWGDYDNDGRLDLAVATFEHEPKNVYHNDGDGTFSDRSSVLGVAEKTMPYIAFGVKFIDADNDGWLDLIFANGHVEDDVADFDKTSTYRQPCVFLHNIHGTQFAVGAQPMGDAAVNSIVGRGLAIGDFDNDGKMDVLVVDSEGAPLLLHNVTHNANHWLMVRLSGTKSNRDGIGALVTVETAGRKLLRRCATDGSYLSASDRRVHFGLGDADAPVRVIVRWPSGQVDSFDRIAVDGIVTLREGATQPETARKP
jgi:enediyne biosynthesis protein E4